MADARRRQHSSGQPGGIRLTGVDARRRDEVLRWLCRRVAAMTGLSVDEVDTDEAFAFHGLDSARIMELAADLAEWSGQPVDPTAFYEFETMALLATEIATDEARRTIARGPAEPRRVDEPIAVVGMACRFPGASSPDEFFANLLAEVDSVGASRPSGPDRDAAGFPAGFIDDVDAFDAAFFRIAPAEAEQMDPQQRMLLQCAWEALEDAATRPSTLRGRPAGVFVGISVNEYGTRTLLNGLLPDAYTGTSNALSIAANRISHALDLRGPSLAVDTACSSSLVAVHLACDSLRSGESEVALAGGANLILTPLIGMSFEAAGVLAADGRCKAFAADADGYVRGEGVGVVVLKRLSKALADGDRVYCSITGTAVAQDGRSNGLMAPSVSAQADLLERACARAGIDPRAVEFVEAHGTGTPIGDAVELTALHRVVGSGRPLGDRCLIGSVKTNIGHLEAAAGIAGLMKAALSLHRRVVPATLHHASPNEMLASGDLGLAVVQEAHDLSAERPIYAGVSSFGFGGTNAHVVLASVPSTPQHPKGAMTGPTALLLSARSGASLTARAEQFRSILAEAGPDEGGVFAHSVAARAAIDLDHHDHRMAVVGDDSRALADALAGGDPETRRRVFRGTAGRRPRRVVLAFGGHGPKWWPVAGGMLDDPADRDFLAEADAIVAGMVGGSLLDRLRAGDDLGRPDVAQPGLFLTQVVSARRWARLGVRPDVVIGHSIGEVAAAHVAGALSLLDALTVAVRRGHYIAEASEAVGSMAVVAMDEAAATAVIAEANARVWVAATNAPSSTVIAGESADIRSLVAALHNGGIEASVLPAVPFASHTPMMASAGARLQAALGSLSPRSADVAIRSTVTGDRVDGAELTGEYWALNLRSPVRWLEAIRSELAAGPAAMLELSPHPVLARPVGEAASVLGLDAVVASAARRGVDIGASTVEAAAVLFCAGVELEWPELTCGADRTVALPLYPWEQSRYWLPGDTAHESGSQWLGRRTIGTLLDERIDSADEPETQRFRGRLGARRQRLFEDHRVGGFVVAPGAGLLELAFEAMSDAGILADHELASVVFEQFLPLDGKAVEVQVRLRQDADRFDLAIHSRRGGPNDSWTRHLTAIVQSRSAVAHPVVPPAQVGSAVDSGTLYESLEALGLAYGPSYRRLEQVSATDRVASGTVGTSPAGELEWVLDPSLLDAAFHAIAACGSVRGTERAWVPVTCGRVTVAGLGAAANARVRVEITRLDDRRIEADVTLVTAGGEPIAAIERLGLAALTALDGSSAAARWLYHAPWREAELGADAASRDAAAGPWLIVADAAGLAGRVAANLSHRGAETVVVSLDRLVVDDSDPATIGRRVRDIAAEALDGERRCAGIVHLGGLDSSDDRTGGALEATCGPVLALAHAAAATGLAPGAALTVVTRFAVSTNGEDVRCDQAPAWGLLGSLALELPHIRFNRIDIDDSPIDVTSAAIADQLLAGVDETQVCLRDGRRFIRRLMHWRAEPSELRPSQPEQRAVKRAATYLVSGGTGGLGLLVARWLVEEGAQRLVLLSRSEPGPEAKATIASLRARGVDVVLTRADISDESEVRRVMREVDEPASAPLRGIIHAAGLLDDGAALGMTMAKFRSVFPAKADGAWNLHRATIDAKIDFFVLFSSAVSVLGSPGQANYAAANAYLDALAHHRRALGLTATSINWGPWSDTGLAEAVQEDKKDDVRLSPQLVSMIPPDEGLRVLSHLIRTGPTQVAVLPYDVANIVQFYPSDSGLSFYDDLIDHATRPGLLSRARLYERPDLGQPYVEPEGPLERSIAELWTSALSIDRVGAEDMFFELGGDSVLSGQIVTRINQLYGVSIELADAIDAMTVRSLARLVADELLTRIEDLDDEEADRLLEQLS